MEREIQKGKGRREKYRKGREGGEKNTERGQRERGQDERIKGRKKEGWMDGQK